MIREYSTFLRDQTLEKKPGFARPNTDQMWIGAAPGSGSIVCRSAAKR